MHSFKGNQEFFCQKNDRTDAFVRKVAITFGFSYKTSYKL